MIVLTGAEVHWRKYRIGIHSRPIKTIPIHSDICIRANANHSETIRINPSLDWSKSNFQSELIRMNPRLEWFGLIMTENSAGSIRERIDSDWKLGFGLVRIHSDWCLGINRIKSDWFLTVLHQTRYKTFFELVRNDSHWFEYRYRNESE